MLMKLKSNESLVTCIQEMMPTYAMSHACRVQDTTRADGKLFGVMRVTYTVSRYKRWHHVALLVNIAPPPLLGSTPRAFVMAGLFGLR